MNHIACNDLTFSHPGGDRLFSEVGFRVGAGAHVGLIGRNGVGKTTLLRLIAGELEPEHGTVVAGGRVAYMPQDVGVGAGDDGRTVRGLCVSTTSPALRSAGERMLLAERRLADGDGEAGMELGEAIGLWAELGGYGLEASWDRACRTVLREAYDAVADRPAASLSGGERKRLVLTLLLSSDAGVVLLDEPDNFLDIPAKRELERAVSGSDKTVLMISHDRAVLEGAVDRVLTLEGRGCWMHHGSYRTYHDAREERQRKRADAVRRWSEEERRLRELVRTFKERARYSPDWAKKADAAETRWRRFADEGPPPAPVVDTQIRVRMRGGESARRVVELRDAAITGLISPFTHEVHFGERVGVVGPNGGGKSHLLRLIAGQIEPDDGLVALGSRVSAGMLSQLNGRDDFAGAEVLTLVADRARGTEAAMGALARYGLVDSARRSYETLSGGQKARLEILTLELEGHNLLLLDEPTDNLDFDSCEALEQALTAFEGTVITVSHDRAHLRTLDRFLMIQHDGSVLELPDVDVALTALCDPSQAAALPLAKVLARPLGA